jgi:TolA-binding protein
MRELNTKFLRLFQWQGQSIRSLAIKSLPIKSLLAKSLPIVFLSMLVLSILILVSLPGIAWAKKMAIQKIVIQSNPLAVQFFVSQKVPVKVIKIEEKELLVALKNAYLSPGFKVQGRQNPALENISIEELDGDVVAVVVTSKNPYGDIRSGFNKAGTSFLVNLEKKKEPGSSAPKIAKPISAAKTPPPKIKPIQQEQALKKEEEKTRLESSPQPPKQKAVPLKEKKTVKIPTPPEYLPPSRDKSEFKGDIRDFYHVVEGLDCDSKQIKNAMLLVKRQLYKEAFNLLDQSGFQENFSCLEQVYYLKPHLYYMGIAKDDYPLLIKAERMFQDALVSYPKSDYVPFAYTAMGMIHIALKNYSAAEGYFNIVKQGFPQYSGMPEVQFHLAGIYDEKGYTDKALLYYKQVFESSLENNYIPDAGVGYGKALFKKRQYFDALTVFNYVIKLNAQKVYESPELLLNMANANFELGQSKPARQNFMRVLNLFLDIPDRDIILSKVGDVYGMENNEEKATKIYELVREKFPDSQGYVNASIGIARYLKTDQEKVDIYEMIKKRFPENTYARISMMRLAEIYQKNKEYNKCIKEIEDLLSTHPRGLRYEAVKLMQKAYEALFEKQLKADEYTSILNRYELEHTKLDKMGSRKIAFSAGMAYLEATLYEEAFNHLINAYKQYKRTARSSELLFGLGLAMDESGRDDDALKLFTAFAKQFPKDKHRVEALTRTGKIYLEKDRFKLSIEKFKKAYALSTNYLAKGKILILHSNVYEKKKNLKAASRLRSQVVKDFAAAPGNNYEVLTESYKILGNTYLSLKSYVQAADAFSTALSFSEGDRAKANLGFLLGDAYQKGNVIGKAKIAFKQVEDSYDSVWARLARQRLSTLELAETVKNS